MKGLIFGICVNRAVALFSKGQNPLFQNQAQQQAQSKDLPPRFSKKGLLNADEVKKKKIIIQISCSTKDLILSVK